MVKLYAALSERSRCGRFLSRAAGSYRFCRWEMVSLILLSDPHFCWHCWAALDTRQSANVRSLLCEAHHELLRWTISLLLNTCDGWRTKRRMDHCCHSALIAIAPIDRL